MARKSSSITEMLTFQQRNYIAIFDCKHKNPLSLHLSRVKKTIVKKTYDLDIARRHKDEARAKIEKGQNDDLRIAIDFTLDHAGSDGLPFLQAWRDGDWDRLRTNWPEWVPFLRSKFPQYWMPESRPSISNS